MCECSRGAINRMRLRRMRLPDGQRHGVLQAGATNPVNADILSSLNLESVSKATDLADGAAPYGYRRQAKRSREDVVGRLRAIDVVVRVNWLITATATPEALIRQIGD